MEFRYSLTLQKCRKMVDRAEIKRVAELLLHRLAEDMQAVALAAPQIGEDVQMFVMRPGLVIINPEYLRKSARMVDEAEGCRSLPALGYLMKRRHKRVMIRYLTLTGRELERTFHDYDARIIQHEMDHLEGIMIHT